MIGGTGNDLFLFSRGGGQDTISSYDATVGKLDAVQFASDILPTDVTVKRSGDSLVLGIAGSTDTLTISSYFNNDGVNPYKVEEIRFTDGTIWTVDQIKVKALTATEGADTLTGYATDDVIAGLGGNDIIYGRAGNDTISGGAGADSLSGEDGNDTIDGGADNDNLYGGNGNDTLLGGAGVDYLSGDAGNDTIDGGAGNDILSGGTGNDTYIFGIGNGTDTITDYDATAGNKDTVQASVNPLDLIFSKSGNNLIVSINATADQATIQNWYSASAYQTEVFKASDGTQLLNTQVDLLIQAMAALSINTGLTWSQLIQQQPNDVQAVLAQYWAPQA